MSIQAQTFTRSVLPFPMDQPWEVIYGPDDFLWLSEKEGKVVRVNTFTGIKYTVYAAPDYFPGSNSEDAPCGLGVGANTYGLALHPDFMNPEHAFIYYIYSYNAGTEAVPQTLFKVARLTWDHDMNEVIANDDLITALPNGFDHFGYRMIAARQNGNDYLYFSIGDTGANIKGCYDSPENNPNLFAQDISVMTGKIHRFNIDGTIPEDNPVPGNSFFTRGHRNPQGLAYNPDADVLYAIEHGHKTDDEVNVLEAGMNYGWMDVQGFHDGNYPGELSYVNSYVPHPDIPNDELREPLFAWGTIPEPAGGYLSWPTVAPSDGIYYGSEGIPEWTNSLLVVTLKNGDDTDQEVFQFQLNADGVTLADSTAENPNPRRFFGEDEDLNGRLRDIAISPDGKKIFLITNNSGIDPIIVYTSEETNAVSAVSTQRVNNIQIAPNPFTSEVRMRFEMLEAGDVKIFISNPFGQTIRMLRAEHLGKGAYMNSWDGRNTKGVRMKPGIYFYTIQSDQTTISGKMILAK